MLFSLYEGKDNGSAASDFILENPDTKRTKQSLRVKVQSLRMECLSKFGNAVLEESKLAHEKQLNAC